MKNKQIIILTVSGVMVFVLGFSGGVAYAGRGRMSVLPDAQGAFRGGRQFTGGEAGGRSGVSPFGSFLGGEVIAKDDRSITIKLQSGGSKLVLLSASTRISSSTLATISDISMGVEITASGSANPDGSITAESVQIGGVGTRRVMR